MNLTIIPTGDGSHTLFNEALNETYHSRHGARVEAEHVYLLHGLSYMLPRRNPIHLLEVGFGTGLNIWLTAIRAIQQPKIFFHVETIEPLPLPWDVIGALNFFQDSAHTELAHQLHAATWSEPVVLLPNFRLIKHPTTVLTAPFRPGIFDVIYFDAFAPNKQPEMWTPQVLGKMYEALAPGGVLTTYCAKGQLKRDLRVCGFRVDSLPGPPGKREMIRAEKT
jgi:tRNA U34 5-methylaminomethyl-2-thiouridine-forming methyltransferase MnmC